MLCSELINNSHIKRKEKKKMEKTKELASLVQTAVIEDLGDIVEREDIKSSIGVVQVLPDYIIRYPKVIIEALSDLYVEYNQAFISDIELNKEWETDYGYCLKIRGSAYVPVNFAIQVDMIGLPDSFLMTAESMSLEEVKEILRTHIYEIENSLAMYQLLEKSFAKNGNDSFFKLQFRAALNNIRKKFNKPIALLAVTDQKYAAMKYSEFGKLNGQIVSDEEVFALSGFDRFFGPKDFKNYLAENNGKCDYLLYVRTSDPIEKLKNPKFEIEHLLLNDPAIRKLIKANALTFNIDAPGADSCRKISDTKSYMARMGMGFEIRTEMDLFSLEFSEHMFAGKKFEDFIGNRLSKGFRSFLKDQGINPEKVESGEISLRAKPLKGAYGCYGHVSGALTKSKFRSALRRELKQREGGYVIQPEMFAPVVVNKSNGQHYTYIDRNFFSFTNGRPHFMGGFRAHMPLDSQEAKKGRNHGNGATVWAEILA
jgi:hypothetical protein